MSTTLRWATYGLMAGLVALPLSGPTHGQRPGTESTEKKAAEPSLDSIEKMLATALKYNPDIRLAEMKVRDDETDLARTRLKVMQKIIALHHALEAQAAEVDRDRAKVKRLGDLVRNRAMQQSVLDEARQDLVRARARLAELGAELPYLLGRRNKGLAEETVRNDFQIGPARYSADVIRDPMAGRIRKALDRTIKVDYREVTLKDLLRDLGAATSGVAIQRNLALADLDAIRFSMRLGEVPVGAALLALQDTLPGLRVVARNYGILVTWEHQVPLGAVRLFDFWKGPAGSARSTSARSR